MPRLKLTLEYAGTRYSGWQVQANARTVQGELDRALRTVLKGAKVDTYGSGRTDAGVHALAQVAHLDTSADVPPATLISRVNAELPHDINLLAVERVPPRFHARHSAVARSYVYQIATRRTAFAKPFVWWVPDALDVARMREAAAPLVGLGDFRAFTDDDPEEKSTKVQVDAIEFERIGQVLLVRVVGSHFLWKMVRRLTGVLVEVGRGKLRPNDMSAMFRNDSDLPARLTAPPSGLYLERVFYEAPPASWPMMPTVRID